LNVILNHQIFTVYLCLSKVWKRPR